MGRRIIKNLSLAVLASFVLIVVLSAEVPGGPTSDIGGNPVCGPTAMNQYRPAAAFDGANYFIVW